MTTPTDPASPKLSDVPPLSDADAASIKPVPATERWLPFVGHVGMVAFTSPQPLPPYPNAPGMGLTAMPVQILSIVDGVAALRFTQPVDMNGAVVVFTLSVRTDLIASVMAFEEAEKPRIVVPGQKRLAVAYDLSAQHRDEVMGAHEGRFLRHEDFVFGHYVLLYGNGHVLVGFAWRINKPHTVVCLVEARMIAIEGYATAELVRTEAASDAIAFHVGASLPEQVVSGVETIIRIPKARALWWRSLQPGEHASIPAV